MLTYKRIKYPHVLSIADLDSLKINYNGVLLSFASFSDRTSAKMTSTRSLTRRISAAGEGSGESSSDLSEIFGTLQESVPNKHNFNSS